MGPLFMAVLPAVTTVMPVVAALGGADGVGDDDVGQVGEELVLDRCTEQGGRGDHGEERGQVVVEVPASSSDSTSGLPMASPVIMTEFTPSVSTRCHTSCGSNLAMSTILEPTKLCPMTHHWVAPCMSGAMGRWTMAPSAPLATIVRGVVDAGVGGGVGAAAQGIEDVLVAPHHTLGHARGAAGVEDVEVVARAGSEVALG